MHHGRAVEVFRSGQGAAKLANRTLAVVDPRFVLGVHERHFALGNAFNVQRPVLAVAVVFGLKADLAGDGFKGLSLLDL